MKEKNEIIYRKPTKQKKKKGPVILKILILTFVIIIAILKIHNMVMMNAVKTEVVSRGQLQKDVQAAGLIIRKEKIITSTHRGIFYKNVAAGERVREEQIIGKVKSGEISQNIYNITAPQTGLVSYHLDGLEKTASLKKFPQLQKKKLFNMESTLKKVETGKEIKKGTPIAKIVDDLHPVLIMVKTADEDFQKLCKYKYPEIKIADKYSYEANFYKKYPQNNFMVFKISRWDRHLITKRKVELDIICETYSGIIIPESAVYEKNNKNGVYVYNEEEYLWKEVNVKGTITDKSIISGINENTIVVSNPEIVAERLK